MTCAGAAGPEALSGWATASGTQRRKLRRLLSDAIAHVPFYRELYARAGVAEKDLDDPDILGRLPILTKDALRDAPLAARRNRRFDCERLSLESTTGSTGTPCSLYLEQSYRRRRNLRFLRALLAAGYRPWQRLMLLTDRYSSPVTRLGNRYYVSVEQPTDGIVAACRQIRPHVLYGFATPLRLLAERLQVEDAGVPPVSAVISTAEALDRLTATALGAAFGCPVHDFYGLTEMGLVAWKRDGASHYTPFPNAVLTEFLPLPRADGAHRLVMTNLDLRASPIIRFDSGDLASLDEVAGTPRIAGIEGRRIDTLVRADGEELSPYRVTDALRDIAGLRRFKVTQHALHRLVVDLEVESGAQSAAAARVRLVLGGLLGETCDIDIRFQDRMIGEGTRKFRPVESKVARA